MLRFRPLLATVALMAAVSAVAQEPPPPAAETDYTKPASPEQARKATEALRLERA